MSRPGDPRQHPHQKGSGKAVERVVRESDRKEAEDKGVRRPPEPEILVQQVERSDGENEEDSGGHEAKMSLSHGGRPAGKPG
jgi:hypothetical protein